MSLPTINLESILIILPLLLFKFLNITNLVISKLLSGVKVFLPLTKQDLINQQEKQQEMKVYHKSVNIVRTCKIDEYLQLRNEHLEKTEFNLVFLILILVSNIGVMIDNIVFSKYENFNIANSLSLIFMIYIVVSLIKSAYQFQNSFYFKSVLIIFSVQFLFLFGILYYDIDFNQVINFDYLTIVKSIKERSELIKSSLESKGISLKNTFEDLGLKEISPFLMKSFFIFIFSFFSSLLFKSISIHSYFLHLFLNKSEVKSQIETIYKYVLYNDNNNIDNTNIEQNNSNKYNKSPILYSFMFTRLTLLIKLKLILSFLVFIMLLDNISYKEINLLLSSYTNIHISEIVYYYLVFSLIIIESFIGLIIQKFNSIIMFNSIYPEIQSITFTNQNIDIFIKSHRQVITTHNSKYWIVFDSDLLLNSLPLIFFITFLNRSFYMIDDNVGKDFKKYFLESVFYTLLVSVYFIKSIFCIGYIYYYKYIGFDMKLRIEE